MNSGLTLTQRQGLAWLADMETTATYTVGDVARLAGVSVRTLHHYDRIGLLVPADRSEGGYRRYSEAELERLHRILSYVELGLSLQAIAALLDDPGIDRAAHLRRQERLLGVRIERLERMRSAVRRTLEADQMGIRLTAEERFEVFGETDPTEHAAEAEGRWGDTDAYRVSQTRTASYSKEEWKRMKAEQDAVNAELVAALESGAGPDSERAMDAAEAARLLISRWFYDCSPRMHRRLGEMYVADARFERTYEELAPGLARYLHTAIEANAERSAN